MGAVFAQFLAGSQNCGKSTSRDFFRSVRGREPEFLKTELLSDVSAQGAELGQIRSQESDVRGLTHDFSGKLRGI